MSRAATTRAAIAQAARQSLAAGGLSALTMSGVAERSGLARATVYNHVRDRSELLGLVVESLLQQAQSLAQEPQDPARLLQVWADWVATDPCVAGLREHDPATLVSAVGGVLQLDDAVADVGVSALARVGAHADLSAVETVVRWLTGFALHPGEPAAREVSAQILGNALTLDARL